MAKGKQYKSIDVLNTSVSELMLLTVFFVLLALAIARADLIGAESDRDGLASRLVQQETQIAELKRRLNELKQTMSLSAQELDETLHKRKTRINSLEKQLSSIGKELTIAKLQNEELTTRLKVAQGERDQLRKTIQTLTNSTGDLDAARKAIIEIRRVAAANDIDPNLPPHQMVRDLEAQIGKMMGTTAQLRKTLKAAGIKDAEKQKSDGEVITARCWASENRRTDAAFDVAIRSNGFVVRKAWPKVRDADANSSKHLTALAQSRNTDIQTFRRLGNAVRSESEKRNPPCIFVVNVQVDRNDEPSAAQFRKLRKIVGRYFYIR